MAIILTQGDNFCMATQWPENSRRSSCDIASYAALISSDWIESTLISYNWHHSNDVSKFKPTLISVFRISLDFKLLQYVGLHWLACICCWFCNSRLAAHKKSYTNSNGLVILVSLLATHYQPLPCHLRISLSASSVSRGRVHLQAYPPTWRRRWRSHKYLLAAATEGS